MNLWQLEDNATTPAMPSPEYLLDPRFTNPMDEGQGVPIGPQSGYGAGSSESSEEGYVPQGGEQQADVSGMRDALEGRAIERQEANRMFQQKLDDTKPY